MFWTYFQKLGKIIPKNPNPNFRGELTARKTQHFFNFKNLLQRGKEEKYEKKRRAKKRVNRAFFPAQSAFVCMRITKTGRALFDAQIFIHPKADYAGKNVLLSA